MCQHLDLWMGGDLFDQAVQILADARALDGGCKPGGQTAEVLLFFHQKNLKALIGQPQGGIHSGHAAADDQGALNYGNLFFLQRVQGGGARHSHSDQFLGLVRGFRRCSGMHP